MKKIFFFGLLSSFISGQLFSQGCVPVRSTGSNIMERPSFNRKANSSKWIFSATNRYFRSFRHFVGNSEQKQRALNGTEVINRSYTLDLNATRILSKRWSVSMNVPVIANTRSSLYEHNGTRHTTGAYGVGDMRFTAYRWMLDPRKAKNGNIQAGLGIKLPTGNYKAQDYFYTGPSTRILGPVDQSIQLGDGGVGLISELNSYYTINRKINLYSNLYYLVNPRETNGVSTARGGPVNANTKAYGMDVMSVPDQYMARLGMNIRFNRLTLSAGARIDGVPARDLIGGSNGFRRPGYIISAEPGFMYRASRFGMFLNVPVAIERNRIQSVPDKIRSQLTGSYYKGDAAFADYVVNLGAFFSLPSLKKVKTINNTKPTNTYRSYNNCTRYSGCQKRCLKL